MMTLPLIPSSAELAQAVADFQGQHILVVGDVMLDCYIHGEVSRISPEAPIPILLQKHTKSVPGGAANVARNLVHLGCRVTLIGAVGQDAQASQLIEALEALPQLDFQPVAAGDRPTTVKTRFMSSGQQMLRLDNEDKEPLSAELTEAICASVERNLPECRMLILSDYAKGVCTKTLLQRVLRLAAAHHIPVVVDPKSSDFSDYAGASLITPNLLELQRAARTAISDIDEIADFAHTIIQQHDIAHMLVTLGGRGMLLVDADSHHHIPAHHCDVYDVSGAGDTVIATISAMLTASDDMVKAMSFGNLAASKVVAKLGTASLCPGELISAGQHQHKSWTIDSLTEQIGSWQADGLKIGFTNGCFDLMHAGHIQLLKACAEKCDKLIIGINSDISVRRLKGDKRPVQSEQSRIAALSALKFVAAVIVFDEDTPIELITALRPDMIAKGGDYQRHEIVGSSVMSDTGGEIHIIPLAEGYSTTSFLASEQS